MNLELTDAAKADLRDIYRYTEEAWSREQADRYVDAPWERFQFMAEEPGRFRLREDLFPGCRIAPQGKHVILFRIQGDRLAVVRILHGAMDLSRHIPPDVTGT